MSNSEKCFIVQDSYMNKSFRLLKPECSVVIPIYNVEAWLRQCLDSVIGQTLKAIEIILVDDGSTDSSGSICEEYAQRDTRIRVIHKPNGGLSSARNAGIYASSAPYLMFIDSDDWVAPEFCEKPMKLAKEQDADLVLFEYDTIQIDGTIVYKQTNMKSGRLTEREAMQYNVLYAQAAWLGLYRKNLFDNIRFPEGKLFEEAAVTHKLVHAAKRVCLLNEPLYHYRVFRMGSITSTPGASFHPDLREMLIVKIEDLHSWGYDEYAVPLAITVLSRFGCQNSELRELARSMKVNDITIMSWRQRLMFKILKISPMIFEMVSFVTGRRRN